MRPRSPSARLLGPLLVVALLLVAMVTPATARSRSKDDDATLSRLLAHATAMAAILESKLDTPAAAVDALVAYKKKQGKAVRKLLVRIFTIAEELDESLRKDWESSFGTSPEVMRLLVAIFGFSSKHAEDAAIKPRFDALLAELGKEFEAAQEAVKAKAGKSAPGAKP